MRTFSSLNIPQNDGVFDRLQPPTHSNRVPATNDPDLESAILGSLDDLLRLLDLEPIGRDRFSVPGARVPMFDRVFGGQLLAQALVAAAATVTGKDPSSLHAAFVGTMSPGRSIDVVVDRVRDGRSMSTRRVTVLDEDRPLLVAFASFHSNGTEPDVSAAAPKAPPPDDVPLLQHWARLLPPAEREHGRGWLERPPPLEIRIPEPPTFLGGPCLGTARAHWMRLPRDVGDDPLRHTALLAYASDFFLMDMVFRVHPAGLGPGKANGVSLDHAIWFHRPVRFDRWHLHTQEAVAIVGDRGLARGMIHDADGRLAASVIQEVLMLPRVAR
jgi:acyl-CoA thioesterase-2